ncbi:MULTISPECIES: DUF4229 domain-containing protein [unclassified Curtobacterium]|uniref:DUF4229 domain-containing protein n=1 Tax=unclassified Curtobacterium TaxID=257496 RepID=UPI000DA9073A|nr:MULTISPECIES: DUF4229 domain-containing protein [unclassified Curtobacterium]PZE26536.1 hypothetical protein DEI86_08700 [Curtobacterium sp. MCBD17_028]PZE74281.1 hypothetical protein DEI82_11375 [Curtobacterium sp. MCBD17_019]PZF58626.1 hypothetical protein DEI92_11305 [Curtobacterium sp. MCBD17_034]PZM34616.1 hypothetical protein DEI90_07875 [Curtobacterium sp. MCBD17_031]WIB62696.1 DUF4229 domain-containing protein [Curtobacterium sp. MCBD17_040]
MKSWLVYSLARIGIFAVLLAVFLVIRLPWPVATIGAALVGLLISYIALPKLRWQVATSFAERRRGPDHDEDTDFEDDFVDAEDSAAPSVDPARSAEPGVVERPASPRADA